MLLIQLNLENMSILQCGNNGGKIAKNLKKSKCDYFFLAGDDGS